MIDSLLWEGYALYPYTPGATKNATPTPFGIVYPPVYASGAATTFDHLELRCVLAASADAVLDAEVRFLAAAGDRHEGSARRVALPPASAAHLARAPAEHETDVSAEGSADPLVVSLRLSAEALGDGMFEVALRVENRTVCAEGLDRAGSPRPVAALDPSRAAGRRRAVHLAARAAVRQRQHLPGARRRG